MAGKWMNPKVCNFDDKVWVEQGPQIIEMKCTEANLSAESTHPNYRIGRPDAHGSIIMPKEACEALRALGTDDGNKAAARLEHEVKERRDRMKVEPVEAGGTMHVVDWRARHAPIMWKVYVWSERGDVYFDKAAGKDVQPMGWEQVDQFEDQKAALATAEKLLKEAA